MEAAGRQSELYCECHFQSSKPQDSEKQREFIYTSIIYVVDLAISAANIDAISATTKEKYSREEKKKSVTIKSVMFTSVRGHALKNNNSNAPLCALHKCASGCGECLPCTTYLFPPAAAAPCQQSQMVRMRAHEHRAKMVLYSQTNQRRLLTYEAKTWGVGGRAHSWGPLEIILEHVHTIRE